MVYTVANLAPIAASPMTKPSGPLRRNRAPAERTEAMAALYRSGKTFREIGDEYSLTRERVRQLLAKAGITSADGGRSVLKARRDAESRQARRQARSDAYWVKTVGMTRKELLDIPAGMRKAYSNQRGHAINRGIPWELTLAEWLEIWKRSRKWSRRGRSAEAYVMCRIRYSEPFAPNNVCICTLRKSSRFGKLLTEQRSKRTRGQNASS